MAALTSAFNPSAKPKSPPQRAGQGSQRAAAVAALSNVLTAEGSSQSPRIGRSSPMAGMTCGLLFPSPAYILRVTISISFMWCY